MPAKPTYVVQYVDMDIQQLEKELNDFKSANPAYRLAHFVATARPEGSCNMHYVAVWATGSG